MELHRQQHSPDSGPAEGSHSPAHPEQPHVSGPHCHLCAPLPPGGGLGLCLHHVLLHGKSIRSPGSGGGGRLGCRSSLGPQFYHACDQPGDAVLCILNYDTLPPPAPSRARTLEAGKRWARLAQARAASRPGLCATAPGRRAGAPPLWQLARSFPVTGPQPLSSLRRAGNWASLELSPSVESCGCGLGPSPVRLG